MADSEQCTVATNWWGIDIVMNDTLTKAIENGTIASGALAALITGAFTTAGVMTGGVAAVIGAAFGAAFVIKIAELQIINNGSGVHWPISWVQMGPLLMSTAGGPTALTAAILVFLHPIRN